MNQCAPWTTKTIAHALQALATSMNGLSQAQAAKRYANTGPNEIEIRVQHASTMFLRQFRSPFNYLLLMVAAISMVAGEYMHGVLVGILTMLNIVIGFVQEYRAYRTVLLLHRLIPSMCTVIREGSQITLARSLLVPGDIIVIKPGDVVPADARLVNQPVLVDESMLTGESIYVAKTIEPLSQEPTQVFQATNMVFAGTSIIAGDAHALVVATGNETIFYTITTVGGSTNFKLSAYEKSLVSISRLILRFVVCTVAIIFCIHVLMRGHINVIDELVFFITLIVAIVPEALPTVVVFALSQAARSMAKYSVVVKRLSAIDDLGDIQILCTDKTGTLTEATLSVDHIVADDVAQFLTYSLLGVDTAVRGASPGQAFDNVLLDYSKQYGYAQDTMIRVLEKKPFNSYDMYSSVLAQDGNRQNYCIYKGAPEILLALSERTHDMASYDAMQEAIVAYGSQGKRLLAVAYKKTDALELTSTKASGLTFLGMAILHNPVKKDVIATLQRAGELGITIKMITGDSKQVADFVGKQVGLMSEQEQVITGKQLGELADDAFDRAVEEHRVFARIDPTTKARIIEALQKTYDVGFLGDGINDVPALSKANVAIVVQEASDVARSVADIVLLKKELSAIITGIMQGRATFCNINKYIKTTLAGNFGNYYSLAFFSLILPYIPLLPTQLLLISILSDLPMIAIASDNVDLDETRRPKQYDVKRMLPLILLIGSIATLSDCIFFAYFHHRPVETFRTLWFLFNIFSAMIVIFSLRTSKFFLAATPPSKTLCAAVACVTVATLVMTYVPLTQSWFSFVTPNVYDLGVMVLITMLFGTAAEWTKLQYVRYAKDHEYR